MDYKEILKGIIDIIKSTEKSDLGFADICTYIGEHCPELKESDDEKLRKSLIKHFRGYQSVHFDGFSSIEVIAWLEKQGEQKPTDKVKPKFKVKYANNEYNVLEIKEIAGVTYFGIEDEPNHIDYVLPDNCEIVNGYGYGVKEKGSPYPTKSAIFSEQNLAWSEEDDEQVNIITNIVQAHCGKLIDCRASLKWLELLKQRFKQAMEGK